MLKDGEDLSGIEEQLHQTIRNIIPKIRYDSIIQIYDTCLDRKSVV